MMSCNGIWLFFLCSIFLNFRKSSSLLMPNNPHRVQFHLPDNTPANHLVGNILGGVSLSQPLTRAMITPDTWFRVTNTGDLFTRDSLDRDTICSRLECCQSDFCQIHLEAYLFDSRPTPNTVRITLFVADENDNAPKFPQLSGGNTESKWWQVSIPESAAVGTKHTLPAATDADSTRFGVHNYKLFSASPRGTMRPDERLPFSLVTPPTTYPMPTVLPAPQLQIDRPLDRETKASYDLYLVVEDAGSPPLTTTLSVRVNLLDTNDNAPSFYNQTNTVITIPESTSIGTVIHRFYVKDLDEGPNGNVTLSLDWPASYPGVNQSVLSRLSSKYMIHPHTGELRVVQPLDYEDELERKVLLVVRASDHGSPQLTASTTLTIALTDVNDNGPVIEVLGVGNRGSEAGPEGNSESPVFKENDPEPQLLRLISVSDPDSVSSGKLSCKLSDQHQSQKDFVLTSYSDTMYGLLNARAFDYEREASRTGHLSVSLECTDSAEPKRTRQQWIQIPLLDVNDNWPQFSQANYEFRVAENTEPGTEIGTIQATDADSGSHGHVTYHLSADNTDWLNLIRIDSRTGAIFVNAMLDRETVKRLDYHVTASDGGPNVSESDRSSQKTNTTGLTIIITDVNDNAPSCTGSKEVHVTENIPVGTQVLKKISVTDPDLGSNGSVVVSLVELPYMYSINLISHGLHSAPTVPEKRQHLPFVIKDDLSLVTSGPLDREQQTQMILTLLVKDRGTPIPLSTTCSLTVIIDDVNDNPPQLIYPRNNSFLFGQREHAEPISPYARASVPANTPYGSRIITIRAKDPDAGVNGTVSYHLIPHAHPLPNESTMTAMMMTDFSGLTQLDSFSEEVPLIYRDGVHLFDLDEQTGILTTAWGQSADQQEVKPEERGNASSASTRRHKVEQPEPGLYAIVVEFRDIGPKPLTTRALFYVNVSEAVGMGFSFGLFSETNLSNTVILVLIMVCSLALIISLTAAIFWVRFRNDGNIVSRQGSHTFGGVGGCPGGYNGPTVITHDSVPNGYFYPTNYPPLASPTDLADMDHRFLDSTMIQCKDGTLQTNWTELNLDTGQSPDYQSGMYGGSLVPTAVDGNTAAFQLCSMSKPDETGSANMYQDGGIHLVPVSGGDRGELTVYQPARTHSVTPNWLTCTDPYSNDPTMIIRMDGGYGPVECVGLGQATNNSTGGSDSGVDSGAGVTLGTITSSSPIMESQMPNHQCGKPTFAEHLHSATIPRTFFTHNNNIPSSTPMSTSEAVKHDPGTMNGHRESYFFLGSATPHTMHLLHQPNSSAGRRENEVDLQSPPSVGTIKRFQYSSNSGTLVSHSTLHSNGLK